MNQYIKRFRAYIQNASWYMGASLFVAFIGIVLNPLYASNLSHADYAIIGYYSSFNLFLYPNITFAYFHIIADSIILLQRRKEKDWAIRFF